MNRTSVVTTFGCFLILLLMLPVAAVGQGAPTIEGLHFLARAVGSRAGPELVPITEAWSRHDFVDSIAVDAVISIPRSQRWGVLLAAEIQFGVAHVVPGTGEDEQIDYNATYENTIWLPSAVSFFSPVPESMVGEEGRVTVSLGSVAPSRTQTQLRRYDNNLVVTWIRVEAILITRAGAIRTREETTTRIIRVSLT